MSLTENLRPLRWLGLMAFMSMSFSLLAQSWTHAKVTNNGESLTWSKQVLLRGFQLIVEPDPTLGTVEVQVTGNILDVTFTSLPGAEGTAEFVVEHFAPTFPFNLVTSAYRVDVSTSFVQAKHDFVAVLQNQTATFTPLENDDFAGGSQLSISAIAVALHGEASVDQGSQTITFVPEEGYDGMTYLTYVVCDEMGACDDAEINICVLPAGPQAAVDTIRLSTDNKSPVTAFVPIADMHLQTSPQYGQVTSMSSEAWEYVPRPDFVGTDRIILEHASGQFLRVVLIDVLDQVSNPEYLQPDNIYTAQDHSISFDARLNDIRKFPIHSFSQPDHGSLRIEDNTFVYTPEAGYVGVTEFTYWIKPLFNTEQTTVKITVGDLPPLAHKVYQLITNQDADLVINYDIPLDGYDLLLTAAMPGNGTLELFDGDQTLSAQCGTAIGYDLIVYSPNPGFTGEDQFELEFRSVNGLVETVKINVDVRPDNGDCACVQECVWPGDANADGQVDLVDLLTIGWHIGTTGPARPSASDEWLGQNAPDWGLNDPGSGMDLKYADADGDGIITALDAQYIEDNYLKQHALIPDLPGAKADFAFSIIPPSGPVLAGQEAEFKIAIGNSQQPVLDMHGVRFSLNLPQGLFVPGSVRMHFDDNSWLGHGAPNLDIKVESKDGRIDAGYTRTTGKAASGHGIVLTMVFIVVDDIEGFAPPGALVPFDIELVGASSTSGSGQHVRIADADATVLVTNPIENEHLKEGSNEPVIPMFEAARVYPNPTRHGILNVVVTGENPLKRIILFDVSGKIRYQMVADALRATVNVTELESGIYMLRAIREDGVFTQKISVINHD